MSPIANRCPICGLPTWRYEGDVWTCENRHLEPYTLVEITHKETAPMSAVPSVPAVPQKRARLYPSRVAAYLVGLSGLSAAVAVPVASLDTSSTAGVVAGVVAIATAYLGWVPGWRAHEAAARMSPTMPGQFPTVAP